MATVLNRSTKQLILSANTPDHPAAQWIIDPDLSAVNGFAPRYWIITGDNVMLMNQAQRDAVDAAELNTARDAIAATMDQLENWMRAFALVVLDEFNLHASRQRALLTAIDNGATLAAIKTAVAAINDIPDRTIAQLKTGVRNKLGS